jgi:aspartate-semialdehyde dehydrogenase
MFPFFPTQPTTASRSAGQLFSDIWHEKETSLEDHYGKELWEGDRGFPSALHDVQVVTIDQLIAVGCRVVISAVAPRLGFLEDKLAAAGITVVSISPYKRQEGALCVLEANHHELSTKLLAALETHYTTRDEHGHATSTFAKQLHHSTPTADAPPAPSLLPLVKSPNCVCCGTSTVLAGLVSLYGPMTNVSITTFQSLSGRGDSKYPAELVVGNVYPLRSTTEPTESLIGYVTGRCSACWFYSCCNVLSFGRSMALYNDGPGSLLGCWNYTSPFFCGLFSLMCDLHCPYDPRVVSLT